MRSKKREYILYLFWASFIHGDTRYDQPVLEGSGKKMGFKTLSSLKGFCKKCYKKDRQLQYCIHNERTNRISWGCFSSCHLLTREISSNKFFPFKQTCFKQVFRLGVLTFNALFKENKGQNFEKSDKTYLERKSWLQFFYKISHEWTGRSGRAV